MAPEADTSTSKGTVPGSAQGPDILVVDDTPANLQLLSSMLKEGGYRVRVVPSGALALSSAASRVPDLILLDINMPRRNGLEVCRLLKADPTTAHIKIVMLTASGSEVDRTRAFDASADDYFVKPFSPIALLDKVYALLG